MPALITVVPGESARLEDPSAAILAETGFAIAAEDGAYLFTEYPIGAREAIVTDVTPSRRLVAQAFGPGESAAIS